MPLSGDDKRKYQRDWVRQKRKPKGSTKEGSTKEGSTGQGSTSVIPLVTPVTSGGVTPKLPVTYAPILLALVDSVKRGKLERICESLKGRGLLGEVRFGIEGPMMDMVSEMLAVTS